MPASPVVEWTFEKDVLNSPSPVLVVFSASWCRPARDMAPAIEAVANELRGTIKIVEIDADRYVDIKSEYAVRGLPTSILFKGGQSMARRVGAFADAESLKEWLNAELIKSSATSYASELPRATTFKLPNGLEVAVISDHRSPVVSHTLWYRVGAADEPEGLSGVARLLEHLMFKSQDDLAEGEFSKIITDLGGVHTAVSRRDMTAYVERIASDQLRPVMELEAARMSNLRLAPGEVERERQTIIEQRQSSIVLDPIMRLREKMDAALYQDHPYSAPVISKVDALNRLSRKDAMRFYKRYYAPNNAVLVVVGDVTEEEVRAMAESTYGKVPANPDVRRRQRAPGPEVLAPRRVTHKDPRASASVFLRQYVVPSYVTAQPGEAEALDILARILCIGPSSLLQHRLVRGAGLAVRAWGAYNSDVVDHGTLVMGAGTSQRNLPAIEAAIDDAIEDIRKNGLTDLQLARAKKALLADHIFAASSQMALADRYGHALASGRTVEQIEAWPTNIAKTRIDDIVRVATEYLDPRRAVTGWLQPG